MKRILTEEELQVLEYGRAVVAGNFGSVDEVEYAAIESIRRETTAATSR